MADYEVRPIYWYTKEDTWAKIQADGTVLVGITDYAQKMLGSLSFVELPETGSPIEQMQTIATVESTKAASEVYSPVSGTVREVNDDVSTDPEMVNNDPYDGGWLVVIEPDNLDMELKNLLDAEAYKVLLTEKSE